MTSPDQASFVITLAEAAKELRCSKAHVSNVVNGKVPHLPRLPVVRIGRRVLIRHEALLEWIRLAEQASAGCYDSTRSEFIA
jgi:excisionase family DNA binding protein